MSKENKAFNSIIHEPARLKIMGLLANVEAANFNYILSSAKLSKGNLSFHLSRLEEADYIISRKFFSGKIPQTEYRITEKGKDKFFEHIREIKSIIDEFPE